MSRPAGQSGQGAAGTQTYGLLTIDKRVLTMPGRTIAIQNIATVSVGTHAQPRSLVPLLVALLSIAIGIGLLAASAGLDSVPGKIAVVLLIVAMFLTIFHFRPQDKSHHLLISTNDGVLSKFSAPRRETLEAVHKILAQKINTGDETAAFAVDFENGTIVPVTDGPGSSVNQPISATGSSNNSTLNGASVPSQTPKAQTASAGNGRSAGETAYAAQSPSGQPANGPLGNGAAHVPSDQYVDFSNFLPAVVEMHRFYARQPNAEHLEQRLHELELLMRAGAPGDHQKTRVRELTGEVCQILQAYPSAVQIFQNIAGLTD